MCTVGLHGPEVTKLDGLALSFLLSTPEQVQEDQRLYLVMFPVQVDYPFLYTSLLSFHHPVMASETGRPSLYCFLAIWKLIQTLPPPAPFLSSLLAIATKGQQEEDGKSDSCAPHKSDLALHTLVLAPRAGQKNFSSWMRDCLVKQGLSLTQAEALVQRIATEVN